jgi:hypothetical protein
VDQEAGMLSSTTLVWAAFVTMTAVMGALHVGVIERKAEFRVGRPSVGEFALQPVRIRRT